MREKKELLDSIYGITYPHKPDIDRTKMIDALGLRAATLHRTSHFVLSR